MTAEERSVIEFNLDAAHFGVRAIEHAARSAQDEGVEIGVELDSYLELAHSLDTEKIAEAIRSISEEKKRHGYSLEGCLLTATRDVLRLRLCHGRIVYSEIDAVFIDVWNGASCISQWLMEEEQRYQREVLTPQMKMLFE